MSLQAALGGQELIGAGETRESVVGLTMDSRQGSNFNRKPGDSIIGRSGNGRSGKYGNAGQNMGSAEEPEAQSVENFQIGDTIGGTYTIVSHLGKGGMGQVFGVEHIMLRQTYALKVLSTDTPSSISWRRFQNEARTIAKLDHQNIIKVHNLGIHDERVPYYVMELLDGETLSALVRREGPLQLNDVIDLFLPLCDGLAYAHAHGIVHRDIKPSNIMLVERNRKIVPKLVDFGLVKLVGGALSPSQQLTATGEVFGSPMYMSPEQSVGRHINERSDIYSLGCTMFEALTGAPPFVGENVVQTILKHQHEAPPTLKHASMGLDFSPEWDAVVQRALAKEASDRYQTMDELAHDLQAIKDGKKLCAQYVTTGSGDLFSEEEEKKRALARGNLLLIASAVLAILLVLVGVGGYITFKQKKQAQVTHVDSLNLGGVQKEQALRLTASEDKQLENVSVPFVQNGGKPINGQKLYKFPADYSLGQLIIHCSDAKGTVLTPEATGDVKIPADARVEFDAGRECGIHPKIFRKFLPDDLRAVQLFGGATDTDDELYYLNHLTNLEILNLDGTDITARGLRIIDEMPRLNHLSLVHTTNLTGADIAKLKCLGRLKLINFNRNKDPRPMLQALKGTKTIAVLCLDQTKVTADDIKLLATMPSLQSISLAYCNITSEELAPLNTLPVLLKLLLRGNNLSPKFIDIFKDNKHLGWIEMSQPKWSEADLARMEAAFHMRYNFRSTDKIEI